MTPAEAAPAGGAYPEPGVFRLSAAVYVEREGKILLLKRQGGELSGAWYLPGGAVDEGETPEQAARRELFEEAGLVPAGKLRLIGLTPMHVYGTESIQITYACESPEGEVMISHEHSGFRWMDPREFRERYFDEERVAAAEAADPRIGAIIRGVRDNLDEYLALRAGR
ncbi:MAG: NUDIX domain-containing protein [Dehalococcoidia bacterium]